MKSWYIYVLKNVKRCLFNRENTLTVVITFGKTIYFFLIEKTKLAELKAFPNQYLIMGSLFQHANQRMRHSLDASGIKSFA